MASWFALGYHVSASEVGVTEELDEQTGELVPVAATAQVEACFRGMPMGWSWALYFCHDALSECGRRAQLSLGLPADVVGDRQEAPVLHPHTARVAPYVDNGNVVAGSRR
eukprot:1979996-Pyramimonas_sp.AAC.1